MRAPAATILAPPFPLRCKWVNSPRLLMERQVGHPVLIEFWDFCRPNSMRTLPYVKAWHERYAADGLVVIGAHSPGFPPSRDAGATREAVARLEVAHPVLLDQELELWREYENVGWPARYLWDERGLLFEYHYGEGAYAETELAIQELLGVSREPLAPLRAEDDPGAEIAAQTQDQPGAYSGPYQAGGVWLVLDGAGGVQVNGEAVAVDHPGAYPVIEHDRHTSGVLELRIGSGVVCHATCFTPGVT